MRFHIFSLALTALLLKKYTDYEKNQLVTENYTIAAEGLKKPCRILFLSDLHEKSFGTKAGEDRLFASIRAAKPELILLGGDLIVSGKRRPFPFSLLQPADKSDLVDRTCAFLKRLQIEYPVYMALGNHETRLRLKAERGNRAAAAKWQKLRRAMEGITLLDRETALLPEWGISITGVTLPMLCYHKLLFRKKHFLSEKCFRRCGGAFPREKSFRICLLHTPLYYREAIDYGADLVLSGHYHGGTIRLPGLGGLMTPQFQFFVKECAGLHRYGRGQVLVNRGLGTHSVNLRLNDRPELSLITLLPGEGGAQESNKDKPVLKEE